MKTAVILFIFSFFFYCFGKKSNFPSCNGTENPFAFWTSDPVFVSEIKNGKRYLAGDPKKNMSMHVVHLYGTPYEMGFAIGKLFQLELPKMLDVTIAMINGYLTEFCDSKIKSFEWLCKKVEELGVVEEVLKLYVEVFTNRYTPKYIMEELKGISDSTGISHELLLGVNAISDVIKAGCSMVIAWGNATKTGNTMQFRALMLKAGLTMQYAPLVSIYHPPNNQPAYALVGYLGNIGLFTGFSESGVGISEKAFVVSTEEDRFGTPWSYVLRNVLMNAKIPDEASTILRTAKRTCPIHIGIGFGKEKKGFIYDYEKSDVKVFTDNNCTTYKTHPRRDGLIFLDEWSQPDINQCYWDVLNSRYGSLDAEFFVRSLASEAQTGGLHAVGMDFEEQLMYVANAQFPLKGSLYGPEAAFNRQFTRLDMKKLWDV